MEQGRGHHLLPQAAECIRLPPLLGLGEEKILLRVTFDKYMIAFVYFFFKKESSCMCIWKGQLEGREECVCMCVRKRDSDIEWDCRRRNNINPSLFLLSWCTLSFSRQKLLFALQERVVKLLCIAMAAYLQVHLVIIWGHHVQFLKKEIVMGKG